MLLAFSGFSGMNTPKQILPNRNFNVMALELLFFSFHPLKYLHNFDKTFEWRIQTFKWPTQTTFQLYMLERIQYIDFCYNEHIARVTTEKLYMNWLTKESTIRKRKLLNCIGRRVPICCQGNSSTCPLNLCL